MSLERLLRRWKADQEFQDNVAEWQILPARAAQKTDFPIGVNAKLVDILKKAGITKLYQHQQQMWEEIEKSHHVVISTGTASGKSLAYNLPVMNSLTSLQGAKALYIFPTKALANDQLNKLHDFFSKEPQIGCLSKDQIRTYDGDTGTNQRKTIRQRARILLTNPDMLHFGILPYHPRWSHFFSGLQYIIVDEVHIYRGVFGSHVANVLRRLLRVTAFYGTSPQFIFTSATIANPEELCSALIGQGVIGIKDDTSATGEKHFILYNPPIINPELGLRRSVLHDAQIYATDIFDEGLNSLIFARTRRSIEILLRSLRNARPEINKSGGIRGYRSGYLAGLRREIEYAIRSGEAKIVVSTNALELGVDIGKLDVVILAGYPGTIASTWQQAGRAGRSAEKSALIFCILGPNPLDQFLAKHPEYFFDKSPEKALINPNHLIILYNHLRCAAYELPFQETDRFGSLDGESIHELLHVMVQERYLHYDSGKFTWISELFPARDVSLRSASSERILIQNAGKTIGEVDEISSYWLLHPDAIYLHEGTSYFVKNLDVQKKIAEIEEIYTDYYTEPRVNISVKVINVTQHTVISYGEKLLGELSVTCQVTGYKKIQWASFSPIGGGELDLPPTEFLTTGYWFTLNDETISVLRSEGLWSSDPNNYGPGWPKIRNLVRARDSYRCQVCGSLESDNSFHVHHKIPFRSFNTSELANQLSNLITLCPNCHKKVEQNLRIRTGLSGLGYILHNLAPLFLMCDLSDLGLDVDAQSTLSGGLPTITLYESMPAGIGMSAELFGLHDQMVSHAFEVVNTCTCQDGCPSCVGPGGENGRGSKKETKAILEIMTQKSSHRSKI